MNIDKVEEDEDTPLIQLRASSVKVRHFLALSEHALMKEAAHPGDEPSCRANASCSSSCCSNFEYVAHKEADKSMTRRTASTRARAIPQSTPAAAPRRYGRGRK